MGQVGLATRRHDIDFIRVVVFALLMLYHTSLIFGTHPWLLSADSPSRAFDLISLASHPWRLSLLFFISGITTASLAKRLSPAEIRRMRSLQLIPPLLFGLFVLIPPQIYIAMRASFDLQMSYLEFWGIYLRFGTVIQPDGRPTSLFCLQHLWFIAYLWLYTAVLTLLLTAGASRLAGLAGRVSRMMSGSGLFLWPIAGLATLRLLVYPVFGETLEVTSDWYAHLVYFGFFVFGYLMADNEEFWAAVVARRGQAIVVAGVTLALITVLFVVWPPGNRSLGATLLHRLGRSAFQWSAIVAILGYCRLLIKGPNPVIRYFNRAMLTYYVLHQTIMLVFAYWLKQTYGFDNSSFLLIVMATAVSCMLLYELQRQAMLLLKGRGGLAVVDVQTG